jgi:hypothetical protein
MSEEYARKKKEAGKSEPRNARPQYSTATLSALVADIAGKK